MIADGRSLVLVIHTDHVLIKAGIHDKAARSFVSKLNHCGCIITSIAIENTEFHIAIDLFAGKQIIFFSACKNEIKGWSKPKEKMTRAFAKVKLK